MRARDFRDANPDRDREETGRREEVPVRGPVAVLLSRFPTVTETFILREVLEMERQGQPVRLVPLLRDDPPVVHEDARAWTGRALFTRFLSRRILAANLRALVAEPSTYLSTLGTLVRGMARNPAALLKSLALFPKAVYLAERLQEEGIRHVHAHYATHPATVAWVMASLSDLTWSVTVHAHDIFVDQTFLGEKLTAATFVRVISEFNRDYLLDRLPDLDPERVRVIHVGVEVDRYAPGAGAEVAGEIPGGSDAGNRPSDGTPLILTVASLRPYKGIPVLLEACYLLGQAGVPFRCRVAGDGPVRSELEALATAYGLDDRVRFLGAVPEDRVPRLLSEASVFVLPSVVQEDGQMDGIPVALMEAMAAGVPVVASDLSGIPELVEDGVTGILVPPDDPEAVAAAVRSVLDRPRRARELAERGRQEVREEFALEGSVTRLLELLEEHVESADGEVRDRIRAFRSLSARASRVGVRRVHEGRDSWVAELLLGDGRPSGEGRPGREDPPEPTGEEGGSGRGSRVPWPREVVLKVHRSRPGASLPAGDRARTEFETLRNLAGFGGQTSARGRKEEDEGGVRPDTTGTAELGAPRPLHIDEEAAALLMTRSAGQSLLDLARASRWAWTDPDADELSAAFRRAGAWLRSFQEQSRIQGSAEPALERVARKALDIVDALGGDVLDPAEARSLSEDLRELRLRAGSSTASVLRHGDFWPGNVLVSPDGGVTVLDFEGVRQGHPLEDPAYFLVQLALYFGYPGLAEKERVLETAFLEGLGSTSARESAAFELCRRAAAARILQADGEPARVLSPTGWLRRRTLLATLRGEER